MLLLRYFLLVTLLVATSWSQTREQKVKQAQAYITQGKSAEAVQVLEPLVKKSWKSKEGREAAVLLAESHLRLANYKKASYYARRFYQYYPSSPYQDRISWVQVRLLLQEGEYFTAARKGFALLHRTQSEPIYQATKTQLTKLLDKHILSTLELENLLSQFQLDNDLVAHLRYSLAKKHHEVKRFKAAAYHLERIQSENPKFKDITAAQSLLSQVQSQGPGVPILLLVGPLSGGLSSLGQEMLQGVALAIEEAEPQLGKVIYRQIDTKGEPALTVAAVREAIAEDNVVGIVGPVMSHSASALASWLSVTYPQIPMVTPTATDDGIAQLGYNIFQFNMPTAQLARDIARYAILCQGHHEFAVLAPNSDYGEIMAREFSKEVKRYGGRIMGSDYYTEGLDDYKAQFEVIKALQWRNYRQRELISWGSADTIDSYYNKGKGGYLQDSVVKIDGFFIPASAPEDAALMARQLSYHNIQSQILGTDGWYGIETMRKGRKYVNEAVFAAPFLERNEIQEWKSFNTNFEKKWGKAPAKNRVSGLSYNAGKFILSNYGDSMVERMRSIEKIDGVYGPIYLDRDTGGNHYSQMVTIQDSKFKMAPICKEFQQTK